MTKGVAAEPLSRPDAFCVRSDILLVHAVHRWISFIGNEKKLSLCFHVIDIKIKKKDSLSSKLKCLHYSNTNGRNYNIVIIIIIIIHLGPSPVQNNNKQNPFSRYCFWRHSSNVKCIYIHNLALYSFLFPLSLRLFLVFSLVSLHPGT